MASSFTARVAAPGAKSRAREASASEGALDGFARAVREGLQKPQKELSPEYFYDAVGSALFEAISVLPEYGLTRADERLIRRHARHIGRRLQGTSVVAELGSGSGRKTRPILEAIARNGDGLSYYAIDVSASALSSCRRQLSDVAGVRVESLQHSYMDGLRELGRRRSTEGRMLVLFLGSTIGNFRSEETPVFLTGVREHMRPGDALLLGTDLIKPTGQLLTAYDDPAGVTAAFNLNLLARINRELKADFQLRNFRHEARWCAAERRIEMHLVSTARQCVTIADAGCRVAFEEGESIWTESSHKFIAAELPELADSTGFVGAAQWIDREWPFAENLWIARE